MKESSGDLHTSIGAKRLLSPLGGSSPSERFQCVVYTPPIPLALWDRGLGVETGEVDPKGFGVLV